MESEPDYFLCGMWDGDGEGCGADMPEKMEPTSAEWKVDYEHCLGTGGLKDGATIAHLMGCQSCRNLYHLAGEFEPGCSSPIHLVVCNVAEVRHYVCPGCGYDNIEVSC